MIDAKLIMPFIRSVQNVFETMLQLPVRTGQPSVKAPGEGAADVSGIISLSGDVEGSVVLSMPTATAERAVSLFTGADLAHTHEDFADAVGELINMISGGAKAQLGFASVSISCPSVVIGGRHAVFAAKDVTCIQIPCDSDIGSFSVNVSFRNLAALHLTKASAA